MWFTFTGHPYKIWRVKDMSLREKLIILRDKSGLSQMALANKLGVSRQAVSRWESGDAVPTIDKLKTLAEVYGVSLDWLCSISASPYEPTPTAEEAGDHAAMDSRKKITRKVKVILVVGIISALLLAGIWLICRKNIQDSDRAKIDTMDCDYVGLPVPQKDGFDFEGLAE